MIGGYIHIGSGIGNQLARLVATRCLALDMGLDWGMIGWENWKGNFINIQHKEFVGQTPTQFYEKKVVENGVDIRSYDPEINFVKDNTIIEGEFQDERYFSHRKNEVREWLKVEPLELPDDLCVIGFRGGEYVGISDLFLTKDYWEEAMAKMIMLNPNMRFEVHTDDPETAKLFFPNLECIHDVGLNWRSVRYARHLIIANSSFYILPSLLNEVVDFVIAPRYWARRNIKVWALPQNYYKKFTYL